MEISAELEWPRDLPPVLRRRLIEIWQRIGPRNKLAFDDFVTEAVEVSLEIFAKAHHPSTIAAPFAPGPAPAIDPANPDAPLDTHRTKCTDELAGKILDLLLDTDQPMKVSEIATRTGISATRIRTIRADWKRLR